MDQDVEETAGSGNGHWTAAADIARGLDSAAASLEGLDRRVRPYVAAHPFVAVGLAVAVGYFLGRMVSRS
jgi:ElaB/YqjD/DUF883 family membrane-anchored ribosome-binding protein